MAKCISTSFRFDCDDKERLHLRNLFEMDGYVRMSQILSREQIAEVLGAVEEVRARLPEEVPKEHQYYDEVGNPESLKQIQQLHTHSVFFNDLAANHALGCLAEALLGEPVVLKNMQYFNKPPGTSKPTPAHQDGYYFMITPQAAVTMWLSLDDANADNGCLFYVKGSAAGPLREHQASGVLGFSQKCTDYGTDTDLANEMAMVASPGDLVDDERATAYQKQLHDQLTREGKL